MQQNRGIWAREMGTALAVLALYVLTLLLPLHQAAGLQRDLDALGFSNLAAWSVCQPLAADENGDGVPGKVLACPAAGIAKQDFAAPLPGPILVPPSALAGFSYAAPPHGLANGLPDHVGQSRAPPVAA